MSAAQTTSYVLKTTLERNLCPQHTFKAVLPLDFLVVFFFVCFVLVWFAVFLLSFFCWKGLFLKNAKNVHKVMKNIQVGIRPIFIGFFGG